MLRASRPRVLDYRGLATVSLGNRPAAKYFHLKHDARQSTGVIVPGLLKDLDGITRWQGQAFKLGAYEAAPVGLDSQGDEHH